MVNIGNGQAALRVHELHPPEAGRSHRRAVVGVLARDDDRLVGLTAPGPVCPRQSDHRIVAVRTRGAEHELLDPVGGELGQLLRQHDHRRVRGLEEGVVVGQLGDLAAYGLPDFLPTIADVDAPQARHPVEDLAAVAVIDENALGRRDHPQVTRTQRVVIGEGVHVATEIGCDHFIGGRKVTQRKHENRLSL